MVPWAFLLAVPDIDNCAQYFRDFLGFHISWEGTGSKKPSPPIANTTAKAGCSRSVPYPGIGQSLEAIKRAGLRIYLATSKREMFASRILDHLKFATCFDGIHGSLPGGELDHKPELLAYILSQHGLSPSHRLMVGDRRYDIAGAHAVGMRGLGVLWGYGTRDELETAGAGQLLDSLPISLVRRSRCSIGS
jgi:phosphoglycolate phosphatase